MSNGFSVGIGSITGVTAYIYQSWSDFAAASIVPLEFAEKLIVAICVAFIGGIAGYMGKKFGEWIIRKIKTRRKS